MWYSKIFLNLFSNILEEYLLTSDVLEEQITQAIRHVHEVYKGCSRENFSKNSDFRLGFNKVAYQCAYLHKYAPFHAALVYEIMSLALVHNPGIIRATLNSIKGPLEVCSLGCGPGTDAIGVLTAMHDQLGFFPCSIKLVDIVPGWEKTFQSVVKELQLKNRNYGSLSESINKKYFDWSFLAADLQKEGNSELDTLLGRADLITLVKVLSGAVHKETSAMIEKIFRLMKPGALILFIDNAAGGFQKLISDAASEHKFVPVFGPLNHELYSNETVLRDRFGYKSCFQTRVSVQFLKKTNIDINKMDLKQMSLFQNYDLLVFPNRFWPEHRPKNINVSFQDFEASNRSFGCESPRHGQTNNFNNSYLSPEPRNRFQNVCYSGNASTPWKENDSFDFGNNCDQRRPFGFESTFNSPSSCSTPDLFDQRLGSDFKPRNFNICVENNFRNVRPIYSSPEDSFNSSLSPVPYQFRTQHTVEVENMNNNCLTAQRKPFYDSSSSFNNYYSSPAVLSYGVQNESGIQDIGMSQKDNYSAFRGKSFDHSSQDSSGYESFISTPRRALLPNPFRNRRPLADINNIVNRHDSFESFISTPRRALLPNPFRNRRPLADINNIVNRHDSFEGYQQTSNYLQSPGPIRNKKKANKKHRKEQKPYKRQEVQ
ncbi:uncharacterized protein TNCT_49681 [Trichonephila clavata]|uniref:Uncharacterized protein n=1 Tax=Trichonephila clavata TaxID=2740835 RepID=A0A8X6G6W9_TRICU|nr:uncharacterized protein TNCT_49681 [Trichonephila clavata]